MPTKYGLVCFRDEFIFRVRRFVKTVTEIKSFILDLDCRFFTLLFLTFKMIFVVIKTFI